MSSRPPKRVRFSKDADTWLRMLKQRTGVTPNLICRLGLCVSLADGETTGRTPPEDSDREISRGTLLGEFDPVMLALIRQRTESVDGLRDHVHHGIALLATRVRSLADVRAVACPGKRKTAGPRRKRSSTS